MSATKISAGVGLLFLAFAIGKYASKSEATAASKASSAAVEDRANRDSTRLANLEQRLAAAEHRPDSDRAESTHSGPELARLAGEVQQLKQANADQHGPASANAARRDGAKEHERQLQARVDSERHQVDRQRTAEERNRLEAAVRDADTNLGIEGGASGTRLEELTCYASLCKGKSSHESEVAFQAFRHAAFVGGEHRVPGWVAVTNVERAGDRRTAVFYIGLGQPSK